MSHPEPHITTWRPFEDGIEIVFFVPFAALSSSSVQPTPPAPGAPPTEGLEVSPLDAVAEAKRLLAESGLTTGVVEDDPDAAPGSIADILADVRAAGKYPNLCMRAARELGIRDVGGKLTEREEATLRSLAREVIGS